MKFKVLKKSNKNSNKKYTYKLKTKTEISIMLPLKHIIKICIYTTHNTENTK